MKTVLIVEDDELCMRLFNDLLQSHGFNTLQSVDGMDTIELAREHRPDLILMDIMLPNVSGVFHTAVLKADSDLKNIPVLAVTAMVMRGDKEKLLEAGCDGYISKPIRVPEFLDTVRSFLKVGRFRLTCDLQVGHTQIDSEHEKLVVLANEFLDFLDEGDNTGCSRKIGEITDAFKSHLVHEEKIMEVLGYFHIEEHKKEHQTIISKYTTLIEDAERNGYGGNFANQLVSLFADFIVRVDMGFKMYLEGMDYRPSVPRESAEHNSHP